MSTERLSQSQKIKTAQKLAAARFVALAGPNPNVTYSDVYDVPFNPSAVSWIAFSGTVSRLTVKHDTAGIGLGKAPVLAVITYRKYGNPQGALRIGIRKVIDDSFTLIAEWPIAWDGQAAAVPRIIEVTGGNSYNMLANDKLSIEYPPDSTNGVELATNTGQGNPAGFTNQSYTGTYGNMTNPLALKIVSKVVT